MIVLDRGSQEWALGHVWTSKMFQMIHLWIYFEFIFEYTDEGNAEGRAPQEHQDAIAVVPPVKLVLSAELNVYFDKIKACLDDSGNTAASGFESFSSTLPDGEPLLSKVSLSYSWKHSTHGSVHQAHK